MSFNTFLTEICTLVLFGIVIIVFGFVFPERDRQLVLNFVPRDVE